MRPAAVAASGRASTRSTIPTALKSRRVVPGRLIDAGFELRLTRNWLFAYRGAYSFDDDLLLSNAARVEYTSSCGCWAAGVEFSSDRAGGLNARVLYRITGFGGDDDWDVGGLLDAL